MKISLLEQKLESAAKEVRSDIFVYPNRFLPFFFQVNADVAAVQKELDEANEKLKKKEK